MLHHRPMINFSQHHCNAFAFRCFFFSLEKKNQQNNELRKLAYFMILIGSS